MVVLPNFANAPQTCFFAKTTHLTENTKLDNNSCHSYQGVNHSLALTITLCGYNCMVSVPVSEQLSQKERCDLVLKERTQICIYISVPVTGLDVAQRVGRFIALLFHDRGTKSG